MTQYQVNTFIIFVERAKNILSKKGDFSFIIPNNWLTIDSNSDFRKFLLEDCGDISLMNFKEKVFEDANVDTCLLFFQKGSKGKNFSFEEVNIKEDFNLPEIKEYKRIEKSLIEEPQYYFAFSKFKNGGIFPILSKIEKNSSILEKISTVSTGIKAYQKGKGEPVQTEEMKKERVYHSFEKLNEKYWKYLEGKDVCRYKLLWQKKEYIDFGKNLAEPRFSIEFDKPRILVRQIPNKLPHCIHAVYTEEKYINDINSMVIFKPEENIDLKYILAVLNSKPISFWFFYTFDKFSRGIFPQFKVSELKRFPIPKISPEAQKPFIEKVDQILEAKKQDPKADTSEWENEIDEMVFDLYGLSEKERGVVRNS